MKNPWAVEGREDRPGLMECLRAIIENQHEIEENNERRWREWLHLWNLEGDLDRNAQYRRQHL